MDFLRKTPQVEWHSFWLIVFLVAYVTATTTTLVMYELFGAVALATSLLLVSVLFFMTWIFGISRLLRRTDVVDVAWGMAITLLAVLSWPLNDYGLQIGLNVQTLATSLVIIWGVRLSYYVLRRMVKKPEDARYVELRKQWRGNEALNAYLRIFVVQAVLATVIAASVVCINLAEPTTIGVWAWVGAGVWLVGLLFEAIGDWQLKRFVTNPKNKGKLMTSGLWRYTRHPNYFGEATMWWGIFIIGLSVPFGWAGIISPVIITYLLLYVSGVPLAEKSAATKRGWKSYAKQTSIFVPRPPTL